MDVLGRALLDFYHHKERKPLLLHNSYGEVEEMPAEIFFRGKDDLPDLETYALSLCWGKILDIGSGAGSHALILQQKGLDVTTMDISEPLIDLMKARGVNKIVHDDIFCYNGLAFDTLLMLMNGIGLAGTLKRLKALLIHLKKLLKPGGQLLFDSSDIGYLYSESNLPLDIHYGEVDYKFEYDGKMSNWFKWLYINQEKLRIICDHTGWKLQIIFEDDSDHYLARLTLS